MWKLDSKGAQKKQQEEEERKNANSNQLEDKEQAYLRRVNRAIFKANNGCLRAAKQIMLGSTEGTPGDETTKMILVKMLKDDLLEEEWVRMNEEIEECKKMAWKINPLSRRRVLAMTKNGAEPGRSRTRNLPPEGTATRSRRSELIRELGSDVGDGLGKQS